VIRVYPIAGMGAVRQVARDRFNPSDAVKRYRSYRDEVRLRGVEVPTEFFHLVFVLGMPASWSKRKRAEHVGQPHRSKPDKDNLEKGITDAIFGEDKGLWDGRVTKLWGERPFLIVSPEPMPIVLPFNVAPYEVAAYDANAHLAGYRFAPTV
jgi:Holliday junction resolvase RusA-like endonuclease